MSFLSDFETLMTTSFTDVVNPVSAAVATGFQPVFLAGFTIWIYLIAYEVAWGKTEDGMTYIITKVGKIFLIGTLALYGWPLLHNFLDGLRGSFVALVSCTGGGCTGTISQALEDNLLTPLGSVWSNLYLSMIDALSVWSVFSFDFLAQVFLMICAMVVYLILTLCVAVLSIVCLCMYMVAFATFNLLMALGPFFLMCMAFPVTQKYFETWTGAVITATLAMAFTALLAVLSASALGLNTVVTDTTGVDWSGGYGFVASMLAKAGFALLLVYLYYKVFDLAASLGGGINMGNNMTGAMRTLVRDAIRQPGGRGGGSRGSNGIGIGGGGGGGGSGGGGPTRSSFRDAVAANHSLSGMAVTAAGRGAMAGGAAVGQGIRAGGRATAAGAQAAASAGVAVGRFAYNRGVAAKRLLR